MNSNIQCNCQICLCVPLRYFLILATLIAEREGRCGISKVEKTRNVNVEDTRVSSHS